MYFIFGRCVLGEPLTLFVAFTALYYYVFHVILCLLVVYCLWYNMEWYCISDQRYIATDVRTRVPDLYGSLCIYEYLHS